MASSRVLALLALSTSLPIAIALPAEYVDVQTRDGVIQPFLLLEPDRAPTATVILFAGGKGDIGVKEDGSITSGNNFLVRTRTRFVDEGLTVVVIDTPSDRDSLYGFRKTKEHAIDIGLVVTYLRDRYGGSIWLVGTSRGTISAANVAARLQKAIDGIVLTASVFEGQKKDSLNDVALGDITVPTLFIHHEDDACKVTPVELVDKFMRKLKNAPIVDKKIFSGGKPPSQTNPCQPLTPHGFIGIESDVVRYISDWIVSH